MAQHAFISHSHKDAEASAAILAALERRGISCWTAPRDVPPGGSYAEAIITAIENASCFVLVYTEHANVSPHVLREVERALSLGINIIPVRFDTSSVSKSLDYLLATVHWLSVIAEPREASIGDVAERIASCVAGSAGPKALRSVPPPAMPPPAAPPPLPVFAPPPRRISTGPLMLGLGLALLAIAGVIFAVQTVRHARSTEMTTALATSANVVPATSATVPSTSAGVPGENIRSADAAPGSTAAEPTDSPETRIAAQSNFAARTPPANDLPAETPDSSGVPAWTRPGANRSPDSPVAVVRHYFGYLSDRNTIKAYELLSTSYRTRETFVTYTRNFASTSALRLISASEVSTRGKTASVSVTFEKNNQKFGWIRWRGPVELVSEPSGWRINSMKGLKASSIRR